MKKRVLFYLFWFAILCVVPCFAQKSGEIKPDFSGNWDLNISKSNLGSLGAAFGGNCKSQMVIAHKEPAVTIRRKIECSVNKPNTKPFISDDTSTYFTDARGESRTFGEESSPFGKETIKSQTKAKDRKIIIKEHILNSSGKEVSSNIIELKLSNDGKTLTYTAGYAPNFGTPQSRDKLFGNRIWIYNISQ